MCGSLPVLWKGLNAWMSPPQPKYSQRRFPTTKDFPGFAHHGVFDRWLRLKGRFGDFVRLLFLLIPKQNLRVSTQPSNSQCNASCWISIDVKIVSFIGVIFEHRYFFFCKIVMQPFKLIRKEIFNQGLVQMYYIDWALFAFRAPIAKPKPPSPSKKKTRKKSVNHWGHSTPACEMNIVFLHSNTEPGPRMSPQHSQTQPWWRQKHGGVSPGVPCPTSVSWKTY